MSELFGKSFSRTELLSRVGSIRQLADVRLAELGDGPGRGVRIADFNTGAGLAFTVLIDRGLDIHAATYKGIPLAFHSARGVVHPAFYEPEGFGWLRSFGGGLLTTCGLTNAGMPGSDEWGDSGLHGRIANTPAELLGYGGQWRGEQYELFLEGRVRETDFWNVNVLMTRRLSAQMGENAVHLVDVVQNQGERPAPFMLLYHCNFGFPLLDAGTRLVLPQKAVQPRDEIAAAGLDGHLRMDTPQPDYREQVFFHQTHADTDGTTTVAVVNDALELAVAITYRQRELPHLVQWKQMGIGNYVLGVEPANCLVLGRAATHRRGELPMLAPGESREMRLQFRVVEGREMIGKLVESILSTSQKS